MAGGDVLDSLTAARLREMLEYDPETGVFRWLIDPSPRIKAGAVAGHAHRISGYRIIVVLTRHYYAHRLAYLYMTGDWPDDLLDHANCNPSDNRWVNLRDASRSQNNANRFATNGGMKGAYFSPTRLGKRKWKAAIRFDGKTRHLGWFDTEADAHSAYSVAARQRFGSFARTN
jgi:hypothetical protein